jgi:glucose/arabinose dehydrogenase/mono/diheme cytochrome c family protein
MRSFTTLLALTAVTHAVPVPLSGEPPVPEPMNRFSPGPVRPAVTLPFPEGKFTLGEAETVVLAGGTNFSRDARSGDLESLLALRFAAQKPVFRPMAVDADTVYQQERELNFGTWRQQLEAAGATVVIAQFGQMEALDGLAKLPEFTAAYHRLLDEFAARTRRVVLVSPMPFEAPGSAFIPDLTKQNEVLRAYAGTVREIARQRGFLFVDLTSAARPAGDRPQRMTENGIHLNAAGLAFAASEIAGQLRVAPSAAAPAELRKVIAEKNRLWSQCWRPSNWSFAYGDRSTVPFAAAAGGQPDLKAAFAQHLPLLAAADARIAALAAGATPAPAAPPVQTAPAAEELGLTPEQELATFTAADGFEVQLYASERDGVVKPVQISWDEHGRMIVTCSPDYPHLAPGAAPGDSILICEDADSDGKADKTWKYAEGLTMTNGAEPGDGGMYVCDYDELLHFRDTDGDGKADERQVVFSGFGIGDTHQLINSINHGEDGSLWFSQGLHVLSHVETPWGIKRLDQAAVWRLRPRSLRLDGMFNRARAGANCWGVVTDDWGQVFHKSGDRPTGYYTLLGMMRTPPGFVAADVDKVAALFQSDVKSTALDIVGSKAMPEAIQGCAITGGFMAGKVELHRFLDDGSGFRTEQLPLLLRSSSPAFRPVDVSQGPDGAIYVADFCNPVIGHYQASYRDPKRDKTHGRIWRITAKGRPAVKPPDLAAMDAATLLRQLSSPERWIRYQARRLLFWKPAAGVLEALDAWTATLSDESLLRQALGIYEAHETVRPALVERLLASQDFRIRAYATRLVGAWSGRLPNAVNLLLKSATDAAPRVRLEAIVASTWLTGPEAVEVPALVSTQPRDRFIDYALTESIRALKPQWQPALAALRFSGDPVQRDFVVKTGGALPVVEHPGKIVYDAVCLNCHQADGKGLPRIYPPLAGSPWVVGDKSIPVRMLLHGLSGPITVNGEPYGTGNPIPMPPSGLDDQQIADVLTWLRSNLGNNASAISPAEVSAIRESHKTRQTLWTLPELTP